MQTSKRNGNHTQPLNQITLLLIKVSHCVAAGAFHWSEFISLLLPFYFKMRSYLPFSLLLNFLFLHTKISTAQNTLITSTITSAPSSVVSQTPEMSASSVSSYYNALATSIPLQQGGDPAAGDAGSTAGAGDSNAGASGHNGSSFTLSTGAIIAIAVVASVVCLGGIASSVLWYFAKKRSWEVRAKMRKSARKIATALTPRRSAFPKDVQNPRKKSNRGLSRIEEVPNTPRLGGNDVEKGNSKLSSFEMSEPPKAKAKWGKKATRP